MTFLSQLAAVMPTAEQGIFSVLGIDWRLLILQIIAFLILVFLLGKFVYPWLMKQVDERQALIEKSAEAATAAQKAAEDSQEKVAGLLEKARQEAAEIIETAKLESSELLSITEKRAKKTADRIAADASAQLGKEVEHARTELYNETLKLVAMATEKVVGSELSGNIDEARIEKALKDAS